MRRARFTLTVWTEGSWDEAGKAQDVLRECLDAAEDDGHLYAYVLERRGELELTERQEADLRAEVSP